MSSLYFFPNIESLATDPFSGITTVCHSPSDDMAQFVQAPGTSFHSFPIAFDFDAKGETVSYPTADGLKGIGYLIKASSPSDMWLFIYQE